MTAVSAGSIDVDNPAKYPVVLSDALLGKETKEIYTGIRYNHKPHSNSDSSVPSMHLRPSSDPARYDLAFNDNDEKYSYNGARSAGNGQYVLIFDPEQKRFVLHRVDSTFDMNLVGAPWTDDEAGLRSQYTQLGPPAASQSPPVQRRVSKSSKTAGTAKSESKRRKSMQAKKPKPPPREPTPEPEEDSDDVLTIEYPEGPPAPKYRFQSTPVLQRHESEEISEEDSDGYHQPEQNQDVDHLKLPSPAANEGAISDEDMELELEAELEQALEEETANAGTGADESSESEEE